MNHFSGGRQTGCAFWDMAFRENEVKGCDEPEVRGDIYARKFQIRFSVEKGFE